MTRTTTAIVPNYNDGHRIGEALRCLKGQTVPFTEILVVDDGSTDDSLAIIQGLLKEPPHARLLRHEKNQGVVAALNTGISEARGEYIFLCSANDTYHPRLVEWCQEMLAQYPQAGMVSGNAGIWDEEKQQAGYDLRLIFPQVRAFYTPRQLVAFSRRSNLYFNGGANALRRDLVLSFGGLLPQLKWHCDWFLYMMLALRAGCAYVPENFSTCRLEGRKSYSHGRFDWLQEKRIIAETILAMKQFPNERRLFRQAAVMPKFDVRTLTLLKDPKLYNFFTPLMVWRMIVYSIAFQLKHFVPRPWLMYLRQFVRV